MVRLFRQLVFQAGIRAGRRIEAAETLAVCVLPDTRKSVCEECEPEGR